MARAANNGRYQTYRYHMLNALKMNEFGLVMLRGCNLYKVADDFVIAWEGHRIIEITPEDECFLVIPPTPLTNAIVKRWAMLSPSVFFRHEKRQRASGLVEYTITRFHTGEGRNDPWHPTGNVTVTSKLRYNLDGSIDIEGLKQKYAVKDGAKYLAFNKRLKSLRAVLFAQIKMHAHQVVPKDWHARSDLQGKIDDILRDTYDCQNRYEHGNAFAVVNRWMETQDPAIARHVAMLAFAACGTEASGEEGMLRQVGNLLRRAQSHYLQKHCVTILEAIPGSANDQQSELQSANGLREVSLFGQAQVRRQDP